MTASALSFLLVDERQQDGDIGKRHLHLLAQHRGHHLGAALVRHVHGVDAGAGLEQLGRKLGLIAAAGRGDS